MIYKSLTSGLLFGFAGITDIKFIYAENLNSGRDQSLDKAHQAVQEVLAD